MMISWKNATIALVAGAGIGIAAAIIARTLFLNAALIGGVAGGVSGALLAATLGRKP
jgi:hypothetical protein